MKYDAISYLQSRLAHLTNPVNLTEFLYDMEEFYSSTKSERGFYPCKQDYLLMISQNWKDETEQVINKLDHLSRLTQ
jgi:hypothetical protein